MASMTPAVWVQLVAGTWVDISADVLWPIRGKYGIQGNGPTDLTASSGSLTFSLRNHAGNSVSLQGAYSPNHANVRAGWTFGIPLLLALTNGAATVFSVSSLTRTGSTATATTSASHGRTTGDWVTVAGAVETDYNGPVQVTVTGAATFTYAVSNSPTSPATGTITSTQAHIKFRGKVHEIDPEAGQYLRQWVHVTAYDGMRALADADVRQVALQINQGEDDLLTAVLNALPSDAQPVARDLDAGLDVYPYAFDQLGHGGKALRLVQEVMINARGFCFTRGDGTFQYQSRGQRAIAATSHTLANAMSGLRVPSTLDGVFNHVRGTLRPKTIDAAATTVLFALTGTPPEIQPGESLTIFGAYRDPDNATDQTLIGADDTSVVTPVENTDYEGNSAVDGSGSDLSSSLSVQITPWASTCKFVVTNNHASLPIFLVTSGGVTLLQCRGKGVYDDAPITVSSISVQTYGERPLSVDLTLQANPNTGQGLVDYIRVTQESLDRIDDVEFPATQSDALMTAALTSEPGQRVTLTEAMTGLAAKDAFIQSVDYELSPAWMTMRWGLAPSGPSNLFILDDAVSGVLDTSALGYA